MPYEGDSPVEAWEYWFDEPPTDGVLAGLKQCARTHSAAEIIEAIEIAGMKRPLITQDQKRLEYMSGVLRRKALQKIDPERALEETKIDALRLRWRKKDAGPWMAERAEVREWLHWLDQRELNVLMGIADEWSDFERLTGEIVERRRCEQRSATEDLTAEINAAAAKLQLIPGGPRRGT
jgi:hypothetical protein